MFSISSIFYDLLLLLLIIDLANEAVDLVVFNDFKGVDEVSFYLTY
jgi:hypothetical protein